MNLINEDYGAHPEFYNALTAVQEGKVYSQISFRSSASNLETALADAYYAACVMYPQQFQDIDPVEKLARYSPSCWAAIPITIWRKPAMRSARLPLVRKHELTDYRKIRPGAFCFCCS